MRRANCSRRTSSGRGRPELIHIVQAAIHFRAKVDYFVDQVFNYPTFAEGFRIAALNGLNKGREPVAPLVGAAG